MFERGIGEVTDVVEKELFRIAPRTEESESWALRPEPTAGIVRAYLQHGMQTLPQPVKLTTTGPMFRYDRPQAGRYRQFWQFDVEAIGDPGPAIDAEIIELGNRFYAEVGVEGVEVLVNSIGDATCRPAYIEELTDYYRGHVADLPATERDRLERNALRLLDSKDPAMTALERGRAADHRPPVRGVRRALRGRQGPPDGGRRDRGASSPRLVRGLDYYTRTAFEFYVAGREGQQQALGGGGRYDGLVELLGGRPTPGHRVRARPRPRRARARGAGERRARRAGPARRGRRARIRRTPSRGCGSPPTSGPPACASARISPAASSGASSRRPARTAPTSR